jgi:hypothetical protein
VPFLPFVLLLAWQALSRSASFALGWATALYFGQVPGRQGRLLSVMSLLAAAWVILIVGFAAPLLVGAALDALGIVERNFEVSPLVAAGLSAGIVLLPPLIAATAVWAELPEERSIDAWLRLLPYSYQATTSLGLAVLEMVAFTPFLLVQRWRRKRVLLQLPLVTRERTDPDEVADALRQALATIGLSRVEIAEATGPRSWPLRTVAYASRRLLGAVVRGEPIQVRTDNLEILAYATNVAIMGPSADAQRARAALTRELAFHDAYQTWSDDAQQLEDELMALRRRLGESDPRDLLTALNELQQRIDCASLNTEEWNILYRLRLQLEVEAGRRSDRSQPDGTGSEPPRERVGVR